MSIATGLLLGTAIDGHNSQVFTGVTPMLNALIATPNFMTSNYIYFIQLPHVCHIFCEYNYYIIIRIY